MAGITALFNTPFYGGTAQATSGVVPWELEVAIGGHAYKINVAEYQRSTLAMLRQPQDNGEEPGEQSLATEGWWKRTATDWSLGAGQLWGDDPRINSNRSQFWASRGVNPWAKGELRLMDDVYQINTAKATQLVLANGYVYAYNSDADKVEWATTTTINNTINYSFSSGSPTAITWTNSTIYGGAPAGTFHNMCVAGGYVYAALGANGVRKTALGASTSSLMTNHNADHIAYANGFLIIADGPHLHTVSVSGSVSTAIFTHWDTAFTWTAFVETPTGILAAGNTGSQAEVYFIGLDDTTGSLKTPISAGKLPLGENVTAMSYYQGIVLLGTSAGMRIATFASGALSYGPTFNTGYQNNESAAHTVRGFSAVGQYVFFTWDGFTDRYTSGTTTEFEGIGRVDLARFSEPLIPAYATDLMVPSTVGSAYDVVAYPIDNTDNSFARIVATGDGIYCNTRYKSVTSGWVLSSRFRYGVPEKKVVASVDVRHHVLAAGDNVALTLYTNDEGTYGETPTALGTSQDVGTAGPPTPISAHGLSAENVSLLTEITVANPVGTYATNAGKLFRWTMRSALTPFRQDEILVPIILFDTVDTNDEYGQDTYYDTLGEYQFLKNLEASRAIVAYQEGAATYQVVVDRVIVKPYAWNNQKTFFNGIVYVRLLTVEV